MAPSSWFFLHTDSEGQKASASHWFTIPGFTKTCVGSLSGTAEGCAGWSCFLLKKHGGWPLLMQKLPEGTDL